MTDSPPRLGPLVELFIVHGETGANEYHVSVHQTQRRTGRRCIVRDPAGALLYDTDDCYDLGNALAAFDHWKQANEEKLNA